MCMASTAGHNNRRQGHDGTFSGSQVFLPSGGVGCGAAQTGRQVPKKPQGGENESCRYCCMETVSLHGCVCCLLIGCRPEGTYVVCIWQRRHGVRGAFSFLPGRKMGSSRFLPCSRSPRSRRRQRAGTRLQHTRSNLRGHTSWNHVRTAWSVGRGGCLERKRNVDVSTNVDQVIVGPTSECNRYCSPSPSPRRYQSTTLQRQPRMNHAFAVGPTFKFTPHSLTRRRRREKRM